MTSLTPLVVLHSAGHGLTESFFPWVNESGNIRINNLQGSASILSHALSLAPPHTHTRALLLATTAHDQTHADQPQCPYHEKKPTSFTHSPSMRDIIIYFLGFSESDCQCFSPLTPNISYNFFMMQRQRHTMQCSNQSLLYTFTMSFWDRHYVLCHDILLNALFPMP